MPDRCDFTSGTLIDGKYQVIKSLGEGSFGKVYAVVTTAGETYALKLLKLWMVHPEIRESLSRRFDMEFETGRIESPYLVHTIAHGYVEGNPYMVMEYCPGGDLASHMTDGTLDMGKVATHTLLGMRDLHTHGKVHRDLKPENVLIKSDGTFALTDFGICGDRNKRMTERNIMGRPRQIFGTYAYMPPEQLSRQRDATVLPTTDIFSFGVMMYQLLTAGELPFGKLDNEGDLPSYIRNGKEGNWNRELLMQAAGEQWFSMIERCLEPDYQRRLQDCNTVLQYIPQSMQGTGYRLDVWEASNKEVDYQTRIVHGVLLRVMQGEEYNTVYYLDDMLRGNNAILRMGRRDTGVSNDISICEETSCYISRHHCTLELDYDRGCWIVRDGQWCMPTMTTGSFTWRRSTNGTFVNSKEVGPEGMPFNPGDIISIGDVKLRAEAY